ACAAREIGEGIREAAAPGLDRVPSARDLAAVHGVAPRAEGVAQPAVRLQDRRRRASQCADGFSGARLEQEGVSFFAEERTWPVSHWYGGSSEAPSPRQKAPLWERTYPIVRITNRASGHVFYARTHDHSTMAVAYTGTASTFYDVRPERRRGSRTSS